MHLALLLVLAAAPATSQTWKFETDGTPEVHIANVDGAVRVDAVDGNSVVFEVVREGPEKSRNEVEVEVVQKGDVIRAQVCCGKCEAEQRRCLGDRNPVRFTVKVPRGTELHVSAVSSPVTVAGVVGEQEISTVNGRVEINGSERQLSVSSVDGEVVLAPRKVVTTSVSTVGGDVRLKLPAKADARVEFTSVGGRFNGSTVALGSQEKTYGAGSQAVEVTTVGGSLSVQE
ncbi:DUF4097 family beta strand repeat-containing protein [Pyxidicoccus xibeiensis]|uniref:DUF4097 family beta strand repeat-containing protein n=1 Tax=Pyxidicoccus xibeiensis TaxID=2906759 RepID=UPI0020A7CDF0|nr:DUF4097 family beta strand repeat-containing protein [Pyxidicoccus xibeiensis]MCP3142466.1 DUF4097 family beta strand repeat-containing protein [Pyxidicoccus xibeiensis]